MLGAMMKLMALFVMSLPITSTYFALAGGKPCNDILKLWFNVTIFLSGVEISTISNGEVLFSPSTNYHLQSFSNVIFIARGSFLRSPLTTKLVCFKLVISFPTLQTYH